MLRKDDADEFKRVIFTREGTMILEIAQHRGWQTA